MWRKKRVHISKDVLINHSISAEGLDLSAEGMYIYCRHAFVEGSINEIGFKLKGEDIRVMARTIHSQPGIGFGVSFIDLPEDTAKKIRAFLVAH